MKFALKAWSAIWKRPRLSLAGLLGISWWAALGLLAVLLVLDGVMFYRFGLGHASVPLPGEMSQPGRIRVREDTMREAAAKIEERLRRFNVVATSSAGVPNPFR